MEGRSVGGGRWSWSVPSGHWFPCGQIPNRPHNSFNSKRPLWWLAPLPPVKGRSVCAVYICIHTYIHTYIHIHVHVHVHIFSPRDRLQS